MRARDALAPITACLTAGDGIDRFLSLIREVRTLEKDHGIRSLPVVNASGYLSGIISMFDLITAMHPAFSHGANVHILPCGRILESMAGKVKGKKVSELMTMPVITVFDSHPLLECAEQMIKHRISALPVVDRGDKPIGMLYKNRIAQAVAHSLMKGTPW